MVIKYLEKIRDSILEDKLDVQKQLTELKLAHKENIAFIKFLEEDNDSSFEAFTPRNVNTFHKKKIEELRREQESLEMNICELENKQKNIENNLNEVTEVIAIAKEKMS